MKRIYEIDGNNFSDLNSFYTELSTKVLKTSEWGHNLDALNDVLRGGFGTPDEGFILIWDNSSVSRQALKDKFDTILDIFHDHKDIQLILK